MSTNNHNPDYNWVKTMTSGPLTQRTNALAIAFSLTLPAPKNPLTYTWDIEPAPHINYSLIHSLIKLAHHSLDKHDLKRYDYLTQARKYYYQAHFKFQQTYRGLADAQAYESILNAEKKEMVAYGEDKVGQWAEIEWQKQRNREDLRRSLEEVEAAKKVRDLVTMHLSKAKRAFVESDVNRLVYVCQHLHEQHKKLQAASKPPPNPTNFPISLPSLPTDFTLTLPPKQPQSQPPPQPPSQTNAHKHSTNPSTKTSSNEDSPTSQDISDSELCPGCVKDAVLVKSMEKGASAGKGEEGSPFELSSKMGMGAATPNAGLKVVVVNKGVAGKGIWDVKGEEEVGCGDAMDLGI
ncbi:MAG: hypothetical protein M1830_009693 [Pleopsidium flavum]|nr:MAG: hypothetical protein M1830_009693 [Pleopsidium flavum]